MIQASGARNPTQMLATLRNAIDENRIDIFLQPMVTLPQRKVRFYEAVTRVRDERDQLIAAEEFISVAEASGLICRVDNMVMLRCVQVLRRLMVRNKDVGAFCNVDRLLLFVLMRESRRKSNREIYGVGIAQTKSLFHQIHDFLDLGLRFFSSALPASG